MDVSVFKEIREASYLSTKKTNRYRPILRYMYEQHRIYNNDVIPAEIFKYLSTLPQCIDYSLNELESDLSSLVTFNNLEEMQDTTEVNTIEEFKKNRKRYRLKNYSIEFEKLLIEMEKNRHRIRGGSLERSLTDQLLNALSQLNSFVLQDEPTKEYLSQLNQLWDEAFERFTKLDNDASSYLSHISSDKLDEMMQTDQFIHFKNEFISYLTDFMIGLKKNAPLIEHEIRSLSNDKINHIIEQLIRYQRTIPKTELIPDEEFSNAYNEAWTGIKNWFISNGSKESKVYYLEIRTNDSISRISRLAQQAAEKHLYIRNRGTDFLHLAKIANQMENVDEAGKLFGYLFGFEGIPHLRTHSEKSTDDDDITVWDCEPDEVEVAFRIRNPSDTQQKRTMKVPKIDVNSLRRKQEFDDQKIREEEAIKKLLSTKSLKVRDMGVVELFILKAILSWIGRGVLNPKGENVYEGRTEHGVKFRLIKHGYEMVTLQCTDGDLEIPDYEFIFSEVLTT
jgi:uncharacterized protein (TIGR02677 family)